MKKRNKGDKMLKENRGKYLWNKELKKIKNKINIANRFKLPTNSIPKKGT